MVALAFEGTEKGSQDGFPFTDYVALQRLDEHRHQAVLTSLEMCLKHLPFRKWLTSKEMAYFGISNTCRISPAHSIKEQYKIYSKLGHYTEDLTNFIYHLSIHPLMQKVSVYDFNGRTNINFLF